MLTQLQITHFMIIDTLDIQFDAGMTAFTGETGAGKSITIDAINLVLGERADSRYVRQGEKQATINALFDVRQQPIVQAWLTAHDFEDTETCHIRRVIGSDGRSKAYINGSASPLQQVKQLAAHLLTIHGQHAHQLLLKPDYQRALLDDFGDYPALVSDVEVSFHRWRKIQHQLTDAIQRNQDKQARQELLEYQVSELTQAALQPNEFDTAHKTLQKLSHAETLIAVFDQLQSDLSAADNNDVLSRLHHCNQSLTPYQALSKHIEAIQTMLTASIVNIEEALAEAQSFASTLSVDKEQLREVEQRLSSLHALARKHKVEPEQLYEHAAQVTEELDALSQLSSSIIELEQQREAAESTYHQAAKKLSAARTRAAKQLAKALTERMQQLNMQGGHFTIQLSPHTAPSADGAETIDFQVATNPGHPGGSLARVASGGELSRLSLAIQLIAAKQIRVGTVIFDEVDVGIGGDTANIVGRMLQALGEKTQVLCVTHLPQVAAHAHHQFCVGKRVEEGMTVSEIEKLNKRTRVAELARMLGGDPDSRSARKHAEALLAE